MYRDAGPRPAAPSREDINKSREEYIQQYNPGATGLKAEDLKDWLNKACPTNPELEPYPDAIELWEKVLEIVRLDFVEDVMPKIFAEGIFVLIPKSDAGEYRGIVLLEILYKVISSIVNSRLLVEVEFNDSLHGNCPGWGTGTAIMEAKLLAQLRCRIDEPLFMVFVDLDMAYYSLDRERALQILALGQTHAA